MMHRLREIPCQMLAPTAVQPRVLVALNQCTTMATEFFKVATESEEDMRFWYSWKNQKGFAFLWCFLCGVAVFGPPLRPPLVIQEKWYKQEKLSHWCPDFFLISSNSILHPFHTLMRSIGGISSHSKVLNTFKASFSEKIEQWVILDCGYVL